MVKFLGAAEKKNKNHGFRFSPPKMGKFLSSSEKIETLNFMGWFCLKDKLLEEKFTQQFPVLTVMGCGKFQQNLNCGF